MKYHQSAKTSISLKISSLNNIQNTSVSHNSRIKKKILVSNGEINNITGFSVAVFPPGEIAHAHCHIDMTEVFFIKSGNGTITIDGKSFDLEPGMCVTVEPGELHELKNLGTTDLTVMYFGINS